MRIQRPFALAAVLSLTLAGCTSAGSDEVAGGDAEMIDFMLTGDDAPGWIITPDEGEVDGPSPDCTGAPYEWPEITMTAYASQFLDRPDESVSVLLKRLDGEAALRVDALRGALAPCAPSGGISYNGAMIDLVGDDSFAYQTNATDDLGDYLFSNMVIACGDLILEVSSISSISYSRELDQAALESLASPVVERLVADQGCGV